MLKNTPAIALALNIVFMMVGALAKIMHYPGAEFFLATGLATYGVFLLLAITEIFGDKGMERNAKFMWFMGLLFTGTLGGLIYLSRRKH